MKRSCLLSLFLLTTAPVFGQANPAPRVNLPSTAPKLPRILNATAVGIEPSFSHTTSRPATPPPAGGLSFAPAVDYDSGGRGADSVVVADVNGDGKLDLLVVNSCADSACGTNSSVGVLLGRGDGTFQDVVTYKSGGLEANSIVVADVNGDGKLDLLVAHECASNTSDCSPGHGGVVGVLLGNGDGTFQTAVAYPSGGRAARSIAVEDINGDGKPDLLVANACFNLGSDGCSNNGAVGVLLGNGDGTFQDAVPYDSGGLTAVSVAVADVNGDHKPDLVVANSNSYAVGVLLGNGDGTFQTAVQYDSGGWADQSVAVHDVNGDGMPDLLVTNQCASSTECASGGVVGVLLGNGDGTFQTAVTYASGGYYAVSVALADVNGDGKTDLLVVNSCETDDNCSNGLGSVGALLGNGDGTFQSAVAYGSGGLEARSVAIGDADGDGKLDLVIAQCPTKNVSCSGNGEVGLLINTSTVPTSTALSSSNNPSAFGQTVTYTALVTKHFGSGTPTGTVRFFDNATSTNLGSSSLNGSGIATVQNSTLGPSTHSIVATYSGDTNFASSASPALIQVVLGAAARFSASALNFGDQTVGSTSATQTVILLNTGDVPLNFTSIKLGGLDPGDFKQTNNCGSSLAGQAICVIFITFTPTKTGSRSAAVVFMDNAPSKVQRILLTGIGALPSVSFNTTSLTFPSQVVFTSSLVKTVELSNEGLGVLNISTIGASGPFTQTNDCGSTVPPGSGCTITITFRPTTIGPLTAALSVRDNAPASPQKVALSGTGTAVKLTPVAIGFGNQPVHTTSLAKTITLSNKSHATVNIMSIAITGGYSNDFSQTNTCGTSVAAGASCFIKVKFTPSGKNSRKATVTITDDGGGSPQTVGLAGTGT